MYNLSNPGNLFLTPLYPELCKRTSLASISWLNIDAKLWVSFYLFFFQIKIGGIYMCDCVLLTESYILYRCLLLCVYVRITFNRTKHNQSKEVKKISAGFWIRLWLHFSLMYISFPGDLIKIKVLFSSLGKSLKFHIPNKLRSYPQGWSWALHLEQQHERDCLISSCLVL